MSAISDILPNAEARLVAGVGGITDAWDANNVRQVSQDDEGWPPTEWACRLSLLSTNAADGNLTRGTLRVDIRYWSPVAQAGDETPLQAELLAELQRVIRALQWSHLNGALDEALELRTTSAPRPATGDDGLGVAAYADFGWGVILGTSYTPPLNDGTGVDRGAAV